MEAAKIIFSVYSIQKTEGQWLVGGGAEFGDISIGDTFTNVYNQEVSLHSEEGFTQETWEHLRSVRLTVLGIEYFRKKVDLLWCKHSGGLILDGDGIDDLSEGEMLTNWTPPDIVRRPWD